MRRRADERPTIYVLLAVLLGGVFALDLFTYLSLAVWVLYFAPLIVSLYSARPLAPVIVSVLATGLVALGYVFSPAPPVAALVQLSQVNRSLASFALITLGFVGRQFVLSKVRLAVQDWVNVGHAQLLGELRGELQVREVARKALAFLCNYVDAQVGSVHVATATSRFERAGGYGLAVPEGPATQIDAGQTLVGQAAADGKVIVVRDVPEGYADVSSGVGKARPRVLVLSPTTADGVTNGVIELGFLGEPSDETRALLEIVASSVGLALRSAQYRQRQAELLEETQRQAEELHAQQEELKASNEELQEQSRALEESRAELEETNAQLEEQARVLETQKEHLSSAQDVLRRKAAEVERASRHKSEFLANMSHELRTPLNSSLILAKLLVDNKQGNLTADQVQYAQNIYTAGNDLLTLINDILDLSKIEAGKLELQVEPVDLTRLFEAARQRFEPLAREKQLALSVAVAPGAPSRLESDPLRLQQVLTNLLSNAVKFTERGGSVRLLAEGVDGDLQLSVSDTGIGIPAHQHEIIFEAFRQADGTTNRKYGGTGLGLSISRELVELMGGRIELVSEPGRGSTFTVVLPMRATVKAPPAPRKTTRVARDGDGAPRLPLLPVEDDRASITAGSRVVLAVEDDPVFAGILRDLARELGFSCVVARGADEGLELARRLRPAGIVLDMGLPDHSGLTVLELLKRDATARHIPIHVVSAHDYQQVAREMGAVGYVLKPVKREQLVAAFQHLDQQLARKARAVLVIEDDAVQREAITRLLSIEGVTVTSVASASEAFEKIEHETFDCVVLDLMLPTESGFALLDRLEKRDAAVVPPIIVYTARALTHDEEQRLRQHARSIIIKGARSPERLLEEVTLFLHQVAADLPEDKRQLLRTALDREAVFVGRRILLVEDDVRNVFALTSALQPKGAEIELARNGLEALKRLAAHPPIDLVLMDIMMPEMDGLTATRELRKRPALERLPVIALTAKAMPDDRRECLEAGANDYIAKPISVDKLVSLCRVWMPR